MLLINIIKGFHQAVRHQSHPETRIFQLKKDFFDSRKKFCVIYNVTFYSHLGGFIHQRISTVQKNNRISHDFLPLSFCYYNRPTGLFSIHEYAGFIYFCNLPFQKKTMSPDLF